MANKITREELERDELAETLQSLSDWFKRNLYTFLIGIGLVVISAILIIGYKSYRKGISEDSSRILKLANQALVDVYNKPDDASRIAGLDGAIAQLQTLIERYPDTPAAHTALYLQGNCYFSKDDLEKAKDIYRRFIETASTDEERAQGEIAMAYAIENEIYFSKAVDKVEEAKAHFQKAMSLAPPKSYQYYFAMMGLARVLELSYQDEEALKLYRTILDERPSPLVGAKDIDPDQQPDFSLGLDAYAQQVADQRLSQLSLKASVRLRAERLEASIKAGHAGANAPRRPTLPSDEVTTPSLAAEPPAAAPADQNGPPAPPMEAPAASQPATTDAPTTGTP